MATVTLCQHSLRCATSLLSYAEVRTRKCVLASYA